MEVPEPAWNNHAHFLDLQFCISAPGGRRELVFGLKDTEIPHLY